MQDNFPCLPSFIKEYYFRSCCQQHPMTVSAQLTTLDWQVTQNKYPALTTSHIHRKPVRHLHWPEWQIQVPLVSLPPHKCASLPCLYYQL
jgi:hypothetical protein